MMAPQPTAPAENAAPATPAQSAPAAQPTPNMGQSDFRPVYKVKCYAGNVEYKLYIDAVTGTVLSSKVDVDDDFFDKRF